MDETQAETQMPPKTGWRGMFTTMPDTFLIIFVLALLAYAATFLFAPGQFEVAGDPARIVPGSFEAADGATPAPLLGNAERTGFLDFFFAGLISGDRYSPAIGLIALLLVIGGVVGMLMQTRAVDNAIEASLPDGKASNEWLILGLFFASSLGGAVFGMGEEAIALTLVLAPALTRAGYDAMTAVLACFAATQIGFGTSWMNPFSVIIAQSISEIAPMSGMGLRIPMWTGFTLIGAIFVWRYARSVRLGLRAPIGPDFADHEDASSGASFNWPHKLIILVFLAGIAWVGWGVAAWGYYLAEITAQFFAIGIAVALIARIGGISRCSFNELMEAFRHGAAQLLPAALIVGAVKGILLMLGGDDPTSASLLNSLLNALSSLTTMVPEWLTAWVMYLVQSVLNFFVVSGSGQASITMPIMAPLADLSGVTRQTAVLAFQLGDGLTNLIVPTSPVLIGCLAAARVNFTDWLRFFWKPMLALMGIASVIVLGAHIAGF